jgi:hypothetical protein
MTKPDLTLPEMQPPSGPVETRIKEVQQWLAALPLADSLATSQQLFHNLYALNRMSLDAKVRLEIMELYHRPVSAVTASLQNAFTQVSLPLSAKKRQLAVFLRQLQMEMAYGYKFVVRDMLSSSALWSKKAALPLVIERAIQYLGEVLLHSYHVYMPCPPGVWREIHALYRYAEEHGLQNEPVAGSREDAAEKVTINRTYLRAVLLGLCGPYQLPQNECIQVNGFLANWAEKAAVSSELSVDNPVGCFLIDLTADLPAMLFPRDIKLKPVPYLRVLSAVELARIAHEDINRLQKGATPQSLRLGVQCIDAVCLDMLRRMVRFWGMAARRQFSRRTSRARFLSICAGVNALHFFSDGQRPFSPPDEQTAGLSSDEQEALFPSNVSVPTAGADDGEVMIDLDALIPEPEPAFLVEANAAMTQEVFRISRWKIRDESAGGLSLVWDENAPTHVRVGDLLGLLDEDANQWRVAVARWLKSEDVTHVEVGVEMLAPSVKPVAVRCITEGGKVAARAVQALMLPAVAALHQPATLLVVPGYCQAGNDIYVLTGDEKPRRVRVMRVLERSAAFEQVLFADSAR